MNEVYNTLSQLISLFRSRTLLLNYTSDAAMQYLKKLSDESKFLGLIIDIDNRKIAHANAAMQEYLARSDEEITHMRFEFINSVIHEEYLYVLPVMISYFNNPNNFLNIYDHMYCLKTPSGWKWTYACTQIARFHRDQTPQYLLTLGCDFNYLLNKNENEFADKYADYFEHNSPKLNLLTDREKEILKLIANEFTTKEIADKLFISPSTVDSHRKNLMQKLGVKNVMGLAKYAILFELDH